MFIASYFRNEIKIAIREKNEDDNHQISNSSSRNLIKKYKFNGLMS